MGPKRKRTDGGPGDNRPSPHRPGDTPHGQHDRNDNGGRGRGRNQRSSFHRRDSSASQGPRGGGQSSPTPQRKNSNSQVTPSSQQSMPAPAAPVASSAPSVSSAMDTSPNRGPLRSDRHYDHLTDERVKTWSSGGRGAVVVHGCQSRDDMDLTELSSLFQEFINAVLERRLDPVEAGTSVKEIIGEAADGSKEPFFAPRALLLDSLSLVLDIGANTYQPNLRVFLQETGVPVTLMREILDPQVLQQLGLIRDSFVKMGIRATTNLLYRQANYNLLREETEGYSKLITELYITDNPVLPNKPDHIFENVKALIGTFDLDVGRVLDVILDVFACTLVKQDKFFVKFLRRSSWWPRTAVESIDTSGFIGGLPTWATPGYPLWATSDEDEAANIASKLARDVAFWDRAREVQIAAYFELGGRRLSDKAAEQAVTNGTDVSDAIAATVKQWKEITHTALPVGNRVAAHLLGFKLLFYYSKNRDPTDVLPANLLYLAALLIKIGFIALPDLYPHLSPPDEDMDKVRQKKEQELEEATRAARGGGQKNALLDTLMLPDDDDNTSAPSGRKDASKKTEAEKKEEPAVKADEPFEQKAVLLTQLLLIGAIPESLFILGRFPWIPDVFPDVLDGIHRILHHSLSKVYDETRPVATASIACPIRNVADADQAGLPKGSVRLSPMYIKKILRWPTADKNDHNDTQDYRYYWDEWSDNVPVCQTVDDVFTLCETFLNLSGVNIGKDAALLTKLAMIGNQSLHDDLSEHNMNRWRDLLKRIMLPALSLTKANASTVSAVWSLVRRYSTTDRFTLYAEWFEGQISRLPAIKAAFDQARHDTRATLKRISLENLSEMARRLSKTAYSSPGVVFRVAFEQLESYPNLIEGFVECAKYFTDLSYDVLVWSLLNSLGKSRSRTQAEHALTTSKWLQALSRFVGKVYRRYSVLTPVPVLYYVNEQLVNGNSTDLIILKEFISSMGGIVDTSDFTDQQILAMAGGEYLRKQTLIRAQDRRFENARSSQRFIKALTDTGLAAQLLINLAHYRQAALFQVNEEDAHIKYLSSIVDDSHKILIQYLDFVASNVDPETFDRLVPPINELLTTYGLDTSLAFLIGRASLSHHMFPWKSKSNVQSKEIADKPAASREVDKDGDAAMSGQKLEDTPEESTQEEIVEVQKTDDQSLIRSALTPIIESTQSIMPPEVQGIISPELYVTFWALQLGDLFCPEKQYREESNRLKTEEAAILRDRSDMTRRGQDRRLKERKELMQLALDITQERKEHTLRQAKWKFHLVKQFSTAFPEPRSNPGQIADSLLENCVLPRILVSPTDAEYTYRFLKALHEWNAPGFKFMSLCDRLFNANRLRVLIFTSSVREAENLGRFLKLLLEDLSRWHKNEPAAGDKGTKDQPRLGAYDKEGKGPADQPHLGFALTVDDDGKPQTFVEHTQFKDMLFGWHKNLNTAIKSCLSGTEWMHIRNAITVLKSILDFFPAVDFMAKQFTSQLQTITKNEAASKTATEGEEAHRVDLSVAAQGAMSELQRRKSKWMMVQAFRSNAAGGTQMTDKSELRATAAEFKPPSDRKSTHAEAEDGEVQDGTKNKGIELKAAPATDALPPRPHPPREPGRRDATPTSTPARTSTPKPNAGPNAGGRGEPRANLPERPPHTLPTRPDVPIPGHYSERHPQGQPSRHDRREPREPREPRESREPRGQRSEARESRDRPDSRPPARDPRENWAAEMANERREYNERRASDNSRNGNRPELLPRHNAEKDKSHRDSRGGRSNEPSHDRPGPSAQPATSANQEPSMNPERAALFQDRPPRTNESDSSQGRRQQSNAPSEKVNPARAALIGDNADNTPTRPSRDEPRGPRGHSPRRASGRHGIDQEHHEIGHSDRSQLPHQPDNREGRARDRSPTQGSHRDRPEDRQGERGPPDNPRDAPGFPRPSSRSQEYGNRAQFEDQNYGRLNPIQSISDIPSGPRGRGRGNRGGHMGSHMGSQIPTGPDNRRAAHPPRPPSPDRQPPTGPSGRNPRRGHEPPAGPLTPANAVPTHPDRARNFGGPQEMPSPSPGVHPDRLARVGGSGAPQNTPPPPPPPPGGPPHGDHRHGGSSTSTPNRQRNDHQAPQGNMSNNPTPEGGEGGRSGGRRQLAGINNMLQANKPEPPRSGSRRNQQRTMLANSDVQVLTGGSPASTPVQERGDPMRNEPPRPSQSNGQQAPREEHDRGRRDREGRSDRSSRSSRRNSRDRERNHSPSRDKDSNNKDPREYRDRRSGAGPGTEGGNREERDPRRPGRSGPKDSMPPPPPGSGRDPSVGGRDGRHRDDGTPSKHGEDWGQGGRGNRGPPKEGGYRPDERRDDRSRKRRSEGGEGPGNDREKRQRR